MLSVFKWIFLLSLLYCGRETKSGNGPISSGSIYPKLHNVSEKTYKEKLAFTRFHCLCRSSVQLEMVEKGQKLLKKTEVGKNKFPFRSHCSSIAKSLVAQWFLFPDKVLQLSDSNNIFQCPFLALCPPLSTGLAGHKSPRIAWLLPQLLGIHILTRYPQCRVVVILYYTELDRSIQINVDFLKY